jgi:hypothetical protein
MRRARRRSSMSSETWREVLSLTGDLDWDVNIPAKRPDFG